LTDVEVGLSRHLLAEFIGTGLLVTVVVGSGVDGISELDLSYSQPLGSPWDAVQTAAQSWVREHPAPSGAPSPTS
jgi:glycerol uptake facilitator-like aquaporin